MKIAVATDFIGSEGNPDRPLRLLSEAGFSHVHWCHHWCTDFIYGKSEIAAIKAMLDQYGLKLLDIHGSAGREKCWFSVEEYQRRAGVEMVANRIRMLRELDGEGVLMMHVPFFRADATTDVKKQARLEFDALKKSIDELLPCMEREGVSIAVENMWGDNWELLGALFESYSAKHIGLCYDSGHGNSQIHKQINYFDQYRSRLEALHLHDNNGNADLHQFPFANNGTVDWEALANIIAQSNYKRALSFELSIKNTPYGEKNEDKDENIVAFLRDSHARCVQFAEMVGKAKMKKKER